MNEMNEQIEWLKSHKFELNESTGEWIRTLDIIGNFKRTKIDLEKQNSNEVSFETRKIQVLRLVVRHFDNDGICGWGTSACVRKAHDIDKLDSEGSNEENYPAVVALNEVSALAETVKESIGLACDDLCRQLISCLKQAAKLSIKELKLSFEDKSVED